MSPRDTRTGGVLERMVLPALERGGYSFRVQQDLGRRLGGGRSRLHWWDRLPDEVGDDEEDVDEGDEE